MGVVWRAHDELLDRTVAVKEVRYSSALGEEVQLLNRRTMREARAAARFEHPNVIVVYDVIEEDDQPWIVMQLVPSKSLGAVIKQDGPLPPGRVAEIGLAVLEALHSAHEAGVLHRDVKPENVLLADDGRVVLTDFGIATLETETQLTMTGLAGTPAFIAPERLRGLPARRESDLWALGATLHTAVEGRAPHERGMVMATMNAVLNEDPDPAPHAGPLAPVIAGLLAKEPEHRLTYAEAARMLREIIRQTRAAEDGPDVDDTPTDPTLRAVPAEDPRPAARPERRPRLWRRPAAPATPAVPPVPPASSPASAQGGAATPPETGARLSPDAGAARQDSPRQGEPGETPESPKTPETPKATAAESPRPSGAGTPRTVPSPSATARQTEPSTEGEPAPRRVLPMAVAVATAIAVVAGVGGWLGLRSAAQQERPQDRPTATGAASSPAASQAPATPSAQPTTPSPSASPSPSPTPSPSQQAGALPEGWKMYKDEELGFSVGLPKGWKPYKRNGPQVYFRGPGTAPNAFLMIEDGGKAKSDPYEDWIRQEPVLKHNFGGYKKLHIKRVDYMKDAADWEFTWKTNSGKCRVRNRGFVTDNGRAYALYWHNLDSRWKKDLHFFDSFAATFKPAD